jgi:tRNA A37 threonylcarbamoyladenosine dehydratase
MKERIFDINPDCKVVTHQMFYLPENADNFPLADFDYVADAIDTVSAKIELAVRCTALNVPLISAMGTGNKLDASRFVVTDLAKTSGCPLARVMRRELKARGITHLKVVYSTEEAKKPLSLFEEDSARIPPASLPYVPPVAGLILAGEIIRTIAQKE